MPYLLLLLALLLCAAGAIRAARLLISTLWLAGASALLASLLYLLGAPELAAIELSVGLALVTVLLVFAIVIAGEPAPAALSVVPRPLALGLVALAVGLLGWMAWPRAEALAPASATTFADALWRQRGLDVLIQVAIIFAGAIGVLNLLADADAPSGREPSAETPDITAKTPRVSRTVWQKRPISFTTKAPRNEGQPYRVSRPPILRAFAAKTPGVARRSSAVDQAERDEAEVEV